MYYIGLMTGTSLDGVDAVLADFNDFPLTAPCLHAHHSSPLPEGLRAVLLSLQQSGPDELHRAALAGVALTDCYAQAVEALLATAGLAAHQIKAIGAHGQTLRHRPELGYSLQWQSPARLVEQCGIAVVADLRSRDIAAGGQGAPLLPGFLATWLGHRGEALSIVNIGGMANVAIIESGQVSGFDTGPGNVLIDSWCAQHLGQAFDANGDWSKTGQIDNRLLNYLIDHEPYFAAPAPKSTGRDRFNTDWLSQRLAGYAQIQGTLPAAQSIAATLTELTAKTLMAGLPAHHRHAYVYGGGARNHYLMERLRHWRPDIKIAPSDELGVAAQHMEALAFAWLAQAHCAGVAGNAPSVTGAKGPRILGAYYPV